jgi:hypothetical protein
MTSRMAIRCLWKYSSRHECVLQRSQRRSQRANLLSLHEPGGRGRTGRAGRCRRSQVSPAGPVCSPRKTARRCAPSGCSTARPVACQNSRRASDLGFCPRHSCSSASPTWS